MKISPKVKNILIIGYILFMFGGAFYIYSISKYTTIDTYVEKKNTTVKSQPAAVTVVVNGSKNYSATMTNQDSVAALLEKIRSNNGITYEKTRYTYGTEIDNVNGQMAPSGYKWRLLMNGKDITFSINDINLVDQATYSLNLVKQ